MLRAQPFLSPLIWSHNYVVSHLVAVFNEPDPLRPLILTQSITENEVMTLLGHTCTALARVGALTLLYLIQKLFAVHIAHSATTQWCDASCLPTRKLL